MAEFEDIENWTLGGNKNSPGQKKQDDTRSSKEANNGAIPWRLVSAVLLVVALTATAAAAYFIGRADKDEDIAAKTGPTAEAAGPNIQDGDTKSDGLKANSTYQDSVAVAKQPWVVANLSDYTLYLSATVGSEQEKAALEGIVSGEQGIFLDRAILEINVDDTVAPASWLQPGPSGFPPFAMFAGSLVENLIDGGFAIGPDNAVAFGRAPREIDKTKFGETLVAFSGAEQLENAIEIVDLRAPTIDVSYIDDVMTITGALPDRDIITILEENTKTLFPNVDNQLSVDPTTFANFNLARFGTNMQVIQHLDEFYYSVTGGVYSITLSADIGFAPGSSELSPQANQFIENFTSLPTFKTRTVEIKGYTDDTGTVESNLELSQERADEVKKVLTANGFPESQIIAEGRGETEFIASNEDEEERARNRRVVFSVLRQY